VTAPTAPAPIATSAFDYELPAERVAQEPVAPRDASRLLEVSADGRLGDHRFSDLAGLLRAGDVCVVNDTRVRRARLRGVREDGGSAELLVVDRLSPSRYACLVRPARRLRPGTSVRIGGALTAVVRDPAPGHPGARLVDMSAGDEDVEAAIARLGEVPLPPYIHTRLADPERYQTVYARGAGESAASPTAGLHFTESLLATLRSANVTIAAVKLGIGIATFVPIRTDDISAHAMHAERYEITPSAAEAINAARAAGGRVIAVGTTVVRALESCARDDGAVTPAAGSTRLFIAPGHRFRCVDALLTNFHQPRSTLLVLLSAFIGMERRSHAYAHALAAGYRFLSFGDCMLCWSPDAL